MGYVPEIQKKKNILGHDLSCNNFSNKYIALEKLCIFLWGYPSQEITLSVILLQFFKYLIKMAENKYLKSTNSC